MAPYCGIVFQKAQAYTVERRSGELVVLVEFEHSDGYGGTIRSCTAIPAPVARELGVEVLDAAEQADRLNGEGKA